MDPTGKKPGRGAYIALDVQVAQRAKQEKTFDKAFGIKVGADFYDELVAYVDHQQARKELFGNDA